MSRLIGGPLHGCEMEVKADTLIVPIFPNSRTPKQNRWQLTKGIYKKTRFHASGETKTVYRFTFGYYEPKKEWE